MGSVKFEYVSTYITVVDVHPFQEVDVSLGNTVEARLGRGAVHLGSRVVGLRAVERLVLDCSTVQLVEVRSRRCWKISEIHACACTPQENNSADRKHDFQESIQLLYHNRTIACTIYTAPVCPQPLKIAPITHAGILSMRRR